MQADLVAKQAPLGSLGSLGCLLAWHDTLYDSPLAGPLAVLLARAAAKQAQHFYALLRSLVRALHGQTLLRPQ